MTLILIFKKLRRHSCLFCISVSYIELDIINQRTELYKKLLNAYGAI